MVGENNLKSFSEYAISISNAYQIEVSLGVIKSNLTRFANNKIHQNISKNKLGLTVRSVYKDKGGYRIGVASGSIRGKKEIDKIVSNADEIAKNQNIDPYFKSLPGPQKYKKTDCYDKKIADLTVLEKAQIIRQGLEEAKKRDMNASGTFETVQGESAIANSEGLLVYDKYTSVTVSAIVHTKDSSGFAQETGYKLSNVNMSRVFSEAINKAEESKNPVEIDPGKYDVILEEEAVGDLVSYLAYMGFGGKHFHEEISFVSGGLGKKVLGNNITIFDDPFQPEGLSSSFDLEGYPKERICLVDKGVIKNIVYDTYTGGKYNKKPTGHSTSSYSFGPIPLNMIFKPGNYSKTEMIKSIKKGILITRFHYSNVHHHKKLNMTGMTKDGTFLIENGKVTKPIKNMRFTQSIVEALNNVEMIGKRQKLIDSIGTHLVPILKINNFNFTSKTEH